MVSRAPASSAARVCDAPGLDRAIERAEVPELHVLHVGREDDEREGAVRLGALDAAEDGRARKGLDDRRQRLLSGHVGRLQAPHHVDGDDGSLRRLGHRVDGQVVQHPAVDEQPAGPGKRRHETGNRHARPDRLEQAATAVDDQPAREQVGADREERLRELLDRQLAEEPLEHPPGLAGADQRDARERVVVERRATDELVMAAVADLLGLPARSRHGRDERAHRAAAVAVDLDPVALELLERPDVGEASCSAAGEHDAERAPDEASSETADAGIGRLGGRESMEGARLDRVEQSADDAGLGRPQHHEVGVRRGRPSRTRSSRRAAAGRPAGRRGRSTRRRRSRRRAARASTRPRRARPRRCRPRRPEDLHRAVALERVRERACDCVDRHSRAERPEREERRSGGWRAQTAARLEQDGELARDGGGEVRVALHQLVEPLAGQAGGASCRGLPARRRERGAPVSRASSPIAAPGPRNRSVRPSSATTRTRPRSTT